MKFDKGRRVAKADITKVLESSAKVRDAVQALEAERKKLYAERDVVAASLAKVRSTPVTAADVKQFMFDAIDSAGRAFVELTEWDAVFDNFARPGLFDGQIERKRSPLTIDKIDKASSGEVSDFGVALGGQGVINTIFFGNKDVGGLHIESALRFYFFFGDEIKRKINERFDDISPAWMSTRETVPLAELRKEEERLMGELVRIGNDISDVEQAIRSVRAGLPSNSDKHLVILDATRPVMAGELHPGAYGSAKPPRIVQD